MNMDINYAKKRKSAGIIDLISIILVIFTVAFPFFQAAIMTKLDYIIIIICVALLMLLLVKKRLSFDKMSITYVLMTVLMSISIFYTVDFTLSIKYLTIIIVGMLLVVVEDSETINFWFKRALVSFSVANVIITLLCYLFPNVMGNLIAFFLPNVNTRFAYISGVLGQTGTNAIVISYSIIYFWIRLINTKKYRLFSIIMLVLSLFALILTGKRGPLLWIFVTALISLFLQQKAKGFKITKIIGVLLLVILMLLFSFALLRNNEAFNSFITRINGDNDDISSGRFELFKNAIKIFEEHIFIGIGAGAYNHFGQGAHNDYLQILAENGIIVSCIFFYFIIYNLYFSIKKYIYEKDESMFFYCGIQIFAFLNAMTSTSFLHFGFFLIYLQCCVAARGKNQKATSTIPAKSI